MVLCFTGESITKHRRQRQDSSDACCRSRPVKSAGSRENGTLCSGHATRSKVSAKISLMGWEGRSEGQSRMSAEPVNHFSVGESTLPARGGWWNGSHHYLSFGLSTPGLRHLRAPPQVFHQRNPGQSHLFRDFLDVLKVDLHGTALASGTLSKSSYRKPSFDSSVTLRRESELLSDG